MTILDPAWSKAISLLIQVAALLEGFEIASILSLWLISGFQKVLDNEELEQASQY